MEWTRSETLALAANRCTHCHGLGIRASRGQTTAPCNCVFRAIFRVCYRRFRECAAPERPLSSINLEYLPGKDTSISYGRKQEEYMADFCGVSKRHLTEDEHKIFRYHFLLAADWKLCCRKLKIDRGDFFHAVYRIEQRLGRVFRELEPYGLYPVDEYFGGSFRNTGRVLPFPGPAESGSKLSPKVPLRKAA